MRSFDPFASSLLDLSSIIQLRRERSHPILVNCSVLASSPEEVEDIALAAVAAGADGVLAEIDPGPERRNARALLPLQLDGVMQRTKALKCTLNALAQHKYSSR
jgi:3-deoxy-7-phosphoheptulonate synthase